MPTHPFPIPSPRILIVGGAALIAVACGGNPGAPSGVVPPAAATAGNGNVGLSANRFEPAGANTVAVCHITGNGTFHLLNINPNALPAHLQHGDVLPENGACPGPVTATAGR
jgi:hypothetical protein